MIFAVVVLNVILVILPTTTPHVQLNATSAVNGNEFPTCHIV